VSVDKLIEWATHELYSKDILKMTLLYTYKIYSNQKQVIDRLVKRFYIPVPPNLSVSEANHFINTRHKKVKKKVLDIVLQWVRNHLNDIDDSSHLVHEVMEFTNDIIRKKVDIWAIEEINEIQEALKETFNIINKENSRIKELEKYIIEISPKNNIEELIPKGSFIEGDPYEFAKQIVLFNFENFKKVKPSELLNKNWEGENANTLAPNILKITKHSDMVISINK
jgi:hypothetical protein